MKRVVKLDGNNDGHKRAWAVFYKAFAFAGIPQLAPNGALVPDQKSMDVLRKERDIKRALFETSERTEGEPEQQPGQLPPRTLKEGPQALVLQQDRLDYLLAKFPRIPWGALESDDVVEAHDMLSAADKVEEPAAEEASK